MIDPATTKFAIVKIATDEFAVLDTPFDSSIPAEVKMSLAINFMTQEKIIGVRAKSDFFQHQKPILVLTVSCFFKLDDESQTKVFATDSRMFTLPQAIAAHFAGLTVGIARGVLHARTEKIVLNGILLPPIEIKDLVTSDIVVQVPSESPEIAT